MENMIDNNVLLGIITILRFQHQKTLNHIFIHIKDSNDRKYIHEFCSKKLLYSRSEYNKSNIVYTKKCTGCGLWSTTRYYYDVDELIFYCHQCEDNKIGCDRECQCDDVSELITDKEIKYKYVPTGKMIIMKDPSVTCYKKLGNYRKHYRKSKR